MDIVTAAGNGDPVNCQFKVIAGMQSAEKIIAQRFVSQLILKKQTVSHYLDAMPRDCLRDRYGSKGRHKNYDIFLPRPREYEFPAVRARFRNQDYSRKQLQDQIDDLQIVV